MPIVLKNDSSSSSSSISKALPVHETNASLLSSATPQHLTSSSSSSSSSSIAYKSNVQSVIQSTSSTNGGCIATSISVPIESSTIQHNISRSHTSIHDSNANYQKNTTSVPSTLSNQYFVFRSSTDHPPIATNQIDSHTPPAYRERSIEETEAAHDLLSLSQSLPPLPAPCVVTILHPVTNYNGNSPCDVQEITANRSNEYITYTSGQTIQYTTNTITTNGTSDDRGDICTRNKKNVSTQFDGDMLPEDSSSSGKLRFFFNSFKLVLLSIY